MARPNRKGSTRDRHCWSLSKASGTSQATKPCKPGTVGLVGTAWWPHMALHLRGSSLYRMASLFP